MIKKILNVIVNPTAEENSTNNKTQPNTEPTIIKPYTSQDSEEIIKLLTNFDNETLVTHITVLEKIVIGLSQRMEIQSEVICRQSEILRDMHASIEEMIYAIDIATTNTSQRDTVPSTHEDPIITHNKKNSLN